MRKSVCISDLTIRAESTDDPYVERSEMKEVFDWNDYLDLIRYVAAKKVHCRREGLNVNIISEFLGQRN